MQAARASCRAGGRLGERVTDRRAADIAREFPDRLGHRGGMPECLICQQKQPSDVIADLPSTWVTAANEAPLPAYVCVVAKHHVEEPYELQSDEQVALWNDAMRVARAIADFVHPKKMNYEIHGNTIRHLHMHLFPRYEGDPFQGGPIDGRRAGFHRSDEELSGLAEAITK